MNLEVQILKIPTYQIISKYLILRNNTLIYIGDCPFHPNDYSTLSVNFETFECEACGAKGNGIDFVMAYRKLAFEDAVLEIVNDFMLVNDGLTDNDEVKLHYYEIFKSLSNIYKNELFFSETLELFNHSWKLSNDNIDLFEVGYCPKKNLALNYFLKNNISLDVGTEIGVLRKSLEGKYSDYFRDRFVFPLFDNQARCVGFYGWKNEGLAKEIISIRSIIFNREDLLYGFSFLKVSIAQEQVIYLVEGIPNLCRVYEKGITNVVGLISNVMSNRAIQYLKNQSKRIAIVFNDDCHGSDLLIEIKRRLSENGVITERFSLNKLLNLELTNHL